jgi:hypothetical protein
MTPPGPLSGLSPWKTNWIPLVNVPAIEASFVVDVGAAKTSCVPGLKASLKFSRFHCRAALPSVLTPR